MTGSPSVLAASVRGPIALATACGADEGIDGRTELVAVFAAEDGTDRPGALTPPLTMPPTTPEMPGTSASRPRSIGRVTFAPTSFALLPNEKGDTAQPCLTRSPAP